VTDKNRIIYVRHQAYNYDGDLVTQGIPNHFVDSLNHDSIIVQIPRLHGRINNRLDKVLSIFDQKRVSRESEHYLRLAEDDFDADDSDMQPIIHRLMKAAVSVELRQNMNVEDEYYSIIKEQEGKVYGLERELAEKQNQLTEKQNQLTEKQNQLAESQNQLAESQNQLAESQNQKRRLVQMLLESGQTVDAIAENLHVDKSSVLALMPKE